MKKYKLKQQGGLSTSTAKPVKPKIAKFNYNAVADPENYTDPTKSGYVANKIQQIPVDRINNWKKIIANPDTSPQAREYAQGLLNGIYQKLDDEAFGLDVVQGISNNPKITFLKPDEGFGGNKGRAFYSFGNNTMHVEPNSVLDYLAEAAHGYQSKLGSDAYKSVPEKLALATGVYPYIRDQVMYSTPGTLEHSAHQEIEPKLTRVYEWGKNRTQNLNTLKRIGKKQQGGPNSSPVIVEKGEVVRDQQGNISQITKNAPSHEDPSLLVGNQDKSVAKGKGGIMVDGLESVLSASQEQINSGERDNNTRDAVIRIRKKEAADIAKQLGLNVQINSSLSPSKFFLKLQESRDNRAKKLVKAMDQKPDRESYQHDHSQSVNLTQLEALPSDDDLYSLVFGMQEQRKIDSPVFAPEETMPQGGAVTTTGYRSDSPDRNNAFNIIPSNRISMKKVDKPLLLMGDGGEVVHAYPDQEYLLPNSTSVLEIPYAQVGGLPTKNGKYWNESTGKWDLTRKDIEEWNAQMNEPGNPLTGGEIPSAKQVLKSKSPLKTTGKQKPVLKPKPVSAHPVNINSFLPDGNPEHIPLDQIPTPESTPLYDGNGKLIGFVPVEKAASGPSDYLTRAESAVGFEGGYTPKEKLVSGESAGIPAKKFTDGMEDLFGLKPYDYLPDLLAYSDASKLDGVPMQFVRNPEIRLKRLNPGSQLQQIRDAYVSGRNTVADPASSQGQAVQVAMNRNYMQSVNDLLGAVENQNTQIANQETLQNAQMQMDEQQRNIQLADTAFVRDLQARDNQRIQKQTALKSIADKIARSEREKNNYKLFKSAFAPKYGISEDGTIQFDDQGNPVTFGGNTLPVNTGIPSGKTKTKTITSPDGKQRVEVTEEQFNAWNSVNKLFKQHGGKSAKYKMC